MRYASPSTAKEASILLNEEKGVSRILAGGTDVLVQMKSGIIEPDLLVDIKTIPGIKDIVKQNNGFKIGAAVSGYELNNHQDLKSSFPGVVEAMDLIGSTQIQGRCTLVGNLCNGSPAADSVPALMAVNATIEIVGPTGTRVCPIKEIPLSPGKTSLKKGEFITSVFIPLMPPLSSDAYLRFTPRTEMDIAVVSAAVSLTLDESGVCLNAQIALGAVAPTVILVEEAAKEIINTKLDKTVLSKMAEKCNKACKPISDKRGTINFRTDVSGVLARRASLIAYNRAGGK